MVHARLTGIKQTITKEWNKLRNKKIYVMKTKEEIWKTTASLTGLSTKKGRKLARLILICFTAKEISADDLDNGKHEWDIKEKKKPWKYAIYDPIQFFGPYTFISVSFFNKKY